MTEVPNPQAPTTADQEQNVQVRLFADDLDTKYANAFRTVPSPEELFLDFGVNEVVTTEDGKNEIHLKLNQRIILNPYTTKRLAIMLSQSIRQYEERFGEIKINAEDREVKQPQAPSA